MVKRNAKTVVNQVTTTTKTRGNKQQRASTSSRQSRSASKEPPSTTTSTSKSKTKATTRGGKRGRPPRNRASSPPKPNEEEIKLLNDNSQTVIEIDDVAALTATNPSPPRANRELTESDDSIELLPPIPFVTSFNDSAHVKKCESESITISSPLKAQAPLTRPVASNGSPAAISCQVRSNLIESDSNGGTNGESKSNNEQIKSNASKEPFSQVTATYQSSRLLFNLIEDEQYSPLHHLRMNYMPKRCYDLESEEDEEEIDSFDQPPVRKMRRNKLSFDDPDLLQSCKLETTPPINEISENVAPRENVQNEKTQENCRPTLRMKLDMFYLQINSSLDDHDYGEHSSSTGRSKSEAPLQTIQPNCNSSSGTNDNARQSAQIEMLNSDDFNSILLDDDDLLSLNAEEPKVSKQESSSTKASLDSTLTNSPRKASELEANATTPVTKSCPALTRQARQITPTPLQQRFEEQLAIGKRARHPIQSTPLQTDKFRASKACIVPESGATGNNLSIIEPKDAALVSHQLEVTVAPQQDVCSLLDDSDFDQFFTDDEDEQCLNELINKLPPQPPIHTKRQEATQNTEKERPLAACHANSLGDSVFASKSDEKEAQAQLGSFDTDFDSEDLLPLTANKVVMQSDQHTVTTDPFLVTMRLKRSPIAADVPYKLLKLNDIERLLSGNWE